MFTFLLLSEQGLPVRYHIHSQAQSLGLYVREENDGEYEGHCWPGSSSWIDYMNPEARKWWASKFAYDQYQGSTDSLFIWNDMNEPSVFNGPEVTMRKTAKYVHFSKQGSLTHDLVRKFFPLTQNSFVIDTTGDGNIEMFIISMV